MFRALADPTRRGLLDLLHGSENGMTLRALCVDAEMTRQAVSKHLAVLEAASLVLSRRTGRTKVHYLNAAPIQAIHQRWISKFDSAKASALGDLDALTEESRCGRSLIRPT